MPKNCSRYTQDTLQICPRYVQDMPEICARYARDMHKICSRYAQDMPEKYAKKKLGQNVLGQNVHYFYASWGKMSLGHFVLGHFVLWGKMSWGKMSPSLFFIILSRHVKEFFLFDWIFFATSILKHPAWPVLDTSGGEKQVSGGYQRLV